MPYDLPGRPVSEPALLVLHGARLLGYADTQRIADRWGLDAHVAEEHLLDAEAYGWVRRSGFDGTTGWTLTDAGRRRNEEMLAAELDQLPGARAGVVAVHERFIPVNAAVTKIIAEWQLADDRADGGETLAALGAATDALGWMEAHLTDELARFTGYQLRFDRARERAHRDPQWIAGVGIDSCHQVWFELHEDLIATLGLRR